MAFNSTIITRKKKLKCGHFDFNFSKGRCVRCAKIEDTQKRMEKETERMIVEEDLSGLIADADAIFSRYVRLKYADKDGNTACFTCGNKKHWTLMQNGHYIKRGHLYLRWDERNTRPQDAECNEYKGGNMAEFTQRLEKENPGITDMLKEEMRLVHKPTREEIRNVISEYIQKFHKLKIKNK